PARPRTPLHTLSPYTTLFRSWQRRKKTFLYPVLNVAGQPAPPPAPGSPADSASRRRRSRLTPVAALIAARSPARFPSATHPRRQDRKSTRLNSSHVKVSYAVC